MPDCPPRPGAQLPRHSRIAIPRTEESNISDTGNAPRCCVVMPGGHPGDASGDGTGSNSMRRQPASRPDLGPTPGPLFVRAPVERLLPTKHSAARRRALPACIHQPVRLPTLPSHPCRSLAGPSAINAAGLVLLLRRGDHLLTLTTQFVTELDKLPLQSLRRVNLTPTSTSKFTLRGLHCTLPTSQSHSHSTSKAGKS